MATWAIGDLHGCYDAFERLLGAIGFDRSRDRLWLVGDLVNRGPDSLGCVRAVRALGDAAACVAGNHDLHLLAKAAGARPRKAKDRFDDVLTAPDRARLLDWLRRRPLLHHDATLGVTMVHAGLHPHWDLATAQALAREVEAELRRDDYERLFNYMYGDEPVQWSPDLAGEERIRFAINVFTRMRYCHPDGRLDLGPSGPPGSQPGGLLPWFEVPGRANADLEIVCGHWSTLGYRVADGVYNIDSSCYYGGRLTAQRLDGDREVIQVECRAAPGAGD